MMMMRAVSNNMNTQNYYSAMSAEGGESMIEFGWDLVPWMLVYVATRRSPPARRYLWYRLYHHYIHLCFTTRAIRMYRLYRLAPMQDETNDVVDGAHVASMLKRLLELYALEVVWAMREGEWEMLLTHHIPALCFWPYAMKALTPQIVSLPFVDLVMIPTLIFRDLPKLLGKAQWMKCWKVTSLALRLGTRIPLLIRCVASTNRAVRLFGLIFLAREPGLVHRTWRRQENPLGIYDRVRKKNI